MLAEMAPETSLPVEDSFVHFVAVEVVIEVVLLVAKL
jgi:hypothetical protein